MAVDDLWALHEEIASLLARKITAEKSKMDQRLRQLGWAQPKGDLVANSDTHPRRPYPEVVPKYRNPVDPSETWAGRGKRPRWLITQLKSGKSLDDFRIIQLSDGAAVSACGSDALHSVP
jgi:DNA-binding protein H-NS